MASMLSARPLTGQSLAAYASSGLKNSAQRPIIVW
jgi:hypothetical protein